MERKLPKNIRQIGNVSDNPKVYIEDYVDTFFNQMCEQAAEEPIGAFLIGESFRTEDQDYIFIHGAVQMQGLSMKGNEVTISDKTWKSACEEGKRYFAGNTILGWMLLAPGIQLKLNTNIIKLHERLFSKKSRMMMIKDSLEKEEAYFVYKYNDLMQIGGHYIYYEKNPAMQDYMIARRKQNCVTPSEAFEDRATKNFRTIINQKDSEKEQKWKNRHMYMASTLVVLLVSVIAVATMNNYDKLNAVQTSVASVVDIAWESDTAESTENSLVIGEEDVSLTKADDDIGIDLEAEAELASVTEMETTAEIEGVESAENNTAISEESEMPDAETPQGDQASVYVVEEGDTLAMISASNYGTISKVDAICSMNGLEDSDYIYVGQKLLLP
ncbi:MAG: LysM peptidoglycan-binding domain-containing protein [Eubacteriales bacterium]